MATYCVCKEYIRVIEMIIIVNMYMFKITSKYYLKRLVLGVVARHRRDSILALFQSLTSKPKKSMLPVSPFLASLAPPCSREGVGGKEDMGPMGKVWWMLPCNIFSFFQN